MSSLQNKSVMSKAIPPQIGGTVRRIAQELDADGVTAAFSWRAAPHHLTRSGPLRCVLMARAEWPWKRAGHRRQVADVAVDHPEEGADGFLIRCDRIEVAHAIVSRAALA
jgi:hypothetical protein